MIKFIKLSDRKFINLSSIIRVEKLKYIREDTGEYVDGIQVTFSNGDNLRFYQDDADLIVAALEDLIEKENK